MAATLATGLPVVALTARAGLQRRLQRAVPPVEGTLACSVSQPVRVRRDGWGIPHIEAATAADLFTAQGYVQAQDRFWQLDFQRRAGAGRLAELLGPPALASDLLARRFRLAASAVAETAILPAEAAEAVAAYSRGVNAYLEWAIAHRALPVECALLAYEPEPWQPSDCLVWTKLMAWGLGGNWESELVRARLVHALGAERAAALEPVYPGGGPLSAEPGIDLADLDEPIAELLAEYSDLVQHTGLGGLLQSAMPASNGWAVHASRSASGHALLANDPHLPLLLPSVWHLSHLTGGGYDVVGAGFLGSPGLIIGHNRHCAWGITNAMVDAQDLYVERLHPTDPTLVAWGDGWERATVVTERIRVRGRPRPVVEDVLITRHGPVINGDWHPAGGKWLRAGASLWNLPHRRTALSPHPSPTEGGESDDTTSAPTPRPSPEGKGALDGDPSSPIPHSAFRIPHSALRHALALRWTALTPAPTLQAVLDLDRARDWGSFRAAVRGWAAPCINMVYADTGGNIGYHLLGAVPLRAKGQGILPVPGWTGTYEWQGTIPFDELPHSYNPPSGYVVTANNRIVGPEYPYFLSREWISGHRARRISALLDAQPLHTLDSCAAIQLDLASAPGLAFSRLLVARLGSHPATDRHGALRRAALDHLAAWDGRMTRDSAAATIYSVTLHYLTRRVYGLAFPDPALLDQYLGMSTQPVTQSTQYVARCVPRLLRAVAADDYAWLVALAGPHPAVPVPGWTALLAAGLDDALRLLRRRLGRDPRRWQWGRVHRVRPTHLLGGLPPLRRLFNPPPLPVGGDRDTVCMSATLPTAPLRSGGNSVSYRQLFDLGAWDRGRTVLAGGQSGHPAAPHYRDQLPLWQTGGYVPLPFSAEAVAAATVAELVLRDLG